MQEEKHLYKGYANKPLVDLHTTEERKQEIKNKAHKLKTLTLNEMQLADLELLAIGALTPLQGFMHENDYFSVIEKMKLSNGIMWPMPIYLDVEESFAKSLTENEEILLLDMQNVPVALMTVESIYELDKDKEAESVYGTKDKEHEGVRKLYEDRKSFALGGKIEMLEPIVEYTFKELRHTPRELRFIFEKLSWKNIVFFQTRNPMHRAHFELTMLASKEANANIVIHPTAGPTKLDDIHYYVRIRCYKAIMKYYPKGLAMLSLVPIAMRFAGPKEALWHAIIRKNYGATHFIVGRHHAEPSPKSNGESFYNAYDAQQLCKKYEKELGLKIVAIENVVYVKELNKYMPISKVPKDATIMHISGTKLREMLKEGKEIPSWFSFPEVIAELKKAFPTKKERGLCIFFTGLPCAGKSTIAKILYAKFLELNEKPVTLLDGDIIRKKINYDLGFTKEDRKKNIERITFIAQEIVKNRGICIISVIAPYESLRLHARKTIEQYGNFVLVYVNTPLNVCMKRDRKGLYAKALKGIIKNFTGISDSFEEPKNPEITIDTTNVSPEEAANTVLSWLRANNYI